jgi:hypothetical protein
MSIMSIVIDSLGMTESDCVQRAHRTCSGGPEIAGIIGKWLSDGGDDTPGLADAADRVPWNCTQWTRVDEVEMPVKWLSRWLAD